MSIDDAIEEIRTLLNKKNERYGDAALSPLRIFSKGDPQQGLLVRIDDKLSRISTTGLSAEDEDTLDDLIGYLILLKVARANTRAR